LPRYAAIDCGTHSTRLMIGDGRETHDRLMRITRLGAGVDASGRLAPDAIERVLACLGEYRAVMDRHDIAGVRLTATSAARDAANRVDLLGPAAEIIGAEPELLTGEEEGRLSFLGATSELDALGAPYLVVDIGGGSTEFSYGTSRCEAVVSVDVGCVRMTEQFLHSDPPGADELANCLQVVALHLDDVLAEMPQAPNASTLVGLAGTVANVAMVEQGLTAYDRDRVHHFTLTRAAVEDVFRTLATEALADRIHNPGLERQRADVIVGGVCVLVSIMRKFDFGECLTSEADILDGLVLSQARSAWPT
jgi:exopolyphosphatase/guanosine-5'-triphosphate,3'-diphosphate pyrophosphatase